MKIFKSSFLKNIQLRSGSLDYDNFEINPNAPFKNQNLFFTEDLIQIGFGETLCVDVGYYPASKPNGFFMVEVILHEDWEKPSYDKCCKSIDEMKRYLQEAIDLADSLSHEKI